MCSQREHLLRIDRYARQRFRHDLTGKPTTGIAKSIRRLPTFIYFQLFFLLCGIVAARNVFNFPNQ